MESHCTKKNLAQTDDHGLENEAEQCKGTEEGDSPRQAIKRCKLPNARPTFLGLPPEILEKVFAYLPATEVYRNVRNACRRLQDIVDGYIQTGKHI